MSYCQICAAWYRDDETTAYAADGICANCARDGWDEGLGGTIFRDPPEPNPQPDGHAEPMAVRCSWCGAHLRGPVDAVLVSHTICADCYQKQITQLEAECPL